MLFRRRAIRGWIRGVFRGKGRRRIGATLRERARSSAADPVRFEALEPRLLLAGDLPSIALIEADNRGLVVLTANADLNASTINNSSVVVSTPGPDQIFGTADDADVARTVSYDAAARQITIRANVPADARYRVRLDASIIRGADGRFLDGEFTGATTVSGNGVAGGDLVFFSRRPTETIVRIITTAGVIDVTMFNDRTPLTVRNFLNYANRGVWDTTFFHRSVANFVIQGGGFFSNSPFANIPTDPPVRNEPGISNLRGTIAMAKLGGNPDSATNQWFFNLGNNSSNLDNQNGGFTVFGEIRGRAGLMVMDELSRFERVNASSVNGAFNELPVVDRAAVESRVPFAIFTSDLIRITRVALLVDVSGEPPMQLPTEGAVVISDPRGSEARVQVFDLDRAGLGAIDNAVQVRFNSRGGISSITIRDGLPAGRIGIAVIGASSVGNITDARTTTQGNIAFIFSASPVSSIRINGSISGFNLNGIIIPGFAFDDDIDGDGDSNDPTAVLVASGFVPSFRVDGDITGDVVLRGGAGSVAVSGTARNADFNLGNAPDRTTAFTLGRVIDSDIRTTGIVSSLRAREWLDPAGRDNRISAGSIRSLQIGGNFEAGLELTRQDDAGMVLGDAVIRGDVFGSEWALRGGVGSIRVAGNAGNWTITSATTLDLLRAGNLNNVNMTFTGRVGSVSVRDWFGGQLQALEAPAISIGGNFSGTLFITGAGLAGQTIVRTLAVRGDLLDAIVTISTGNARSITVAGDMIRTELRINNANLNTLRVGVVRNSTINGSRTINLVTAARFENSTILGGEYKNVIARIGGYTGEIRPLVVERLTINGDFEGVINTRAAPNTLIAGAVRNSAINLTFRPDETFQVIRNFTIRGTMTRSDFRLAGIGQNLTIGGMVDSGLYVGAPSGLVGLPGSGTGFRQGSRLTSLIIGSPGAANTFVNSYVVANELRTARIFGVQPDNFGRIFGVAAGTIQQLFSRVGNISQRLNADSATPAPIGDYHVHLAFMPPAGTA